MAHIKLKEFEDIRVFVEEEKSMSNIAHKYISTIDRFKKNLKAKKMYLSIVKDEIHFAYVPKTQIRKQYNLTIDKMNQLLKTFQYEIEVIDELIETSSY
jgi:arginase family enzyme